MGKKSTLSAGNVFYEARMAAASWNDKLNSREGTAEITGIDRTRLAHIELGSINPHPEEVLILADTYNAPELHNHFCARLCPLGKQTIRPVELHELEKTALKLVASLRNLPQIKDDLITIASDGTIHDHEKPQMERILCELNEVAARIDALKLYCQKDFGNRTN